MRHIALAVAILFLSAQSRSEDLPFAEVVGGISGDRTAWWFRTTYHPVGKAVHGIPIAKIDNSWCEAELFSVEKFPREIADELSRVFADSEDDAKYWRSSRMAFSTPKFSSGPYKELVASVGVYSQCVSGETGVFLVVASRPDTPRATLVFKDAIPSAKLAMLRLFPRKYVIANWCYGCDDASRYWWKGGRFQILPSATAVK